MSKTLKFGFNETKVRSAVPDELKQLPRWLVWKWEERNGKPTKIPVDAKTFGAGKSNDLTTWTDFETAIKTCVSNSSLAGVGFVFTSADDIVGIDLDAVVDPATNEIKPWATSVIQTLNTYTELSPSGTGLKLFCRGKIKINHNKPKAGTEYAEAFEIYNTRRFFTVTGERLPNTFTGIEKRTEQIKLVYEQFIEATWGKEQPKSKSKSTPPKLSAAGTELARIQSALAVIPADDYRVWMEIGFALHWWENQTEEGKQNARLLFDQWSKTSPKFNEHGQAKFWENIQAEGNGNGTITLGTLYQKARDNQWTPPTETSGLPAFRLPHGDYPIKASATELAKLVTASKTMFGRGNVVVRLSRNENGSPILMPITNASFCSEIERVCAPYYTSDEGPEPSVVGEAIARSLKESEYFLSNINHITTITRCPVIVENGDGTCNQIHDYSSKQCLLASGEKCEMMALDTAIKLITDIFIDTNFVADGDRSRAIANLLTPALIFGGILNARAPIFLIEADESQAGKGYQQKIIASIYNSDVAVANQHKGLGSIGESFNKHLIDGANFISLDNVRGKIDCPEIESFLTEDRYHARALRVDMTIDPKKTIVMMTSNRADVQKDLANRASIVRILKQPESYVYRTFTEGDLLDHIRANQPRYLGAVFMVVANWVKQGKPKTNEGRHDFRKWAQPLDWIIQTLFKLTPLMDGSNEAKLRMITPHIGWLRDVALVLARENTGEWLRTNKIIDILSLDGTVEIPGLDGKDLEDSETSKACQQQFGRRMTKVFGAAMEMPIDRLIVYRQKGDWHDGHQPWEYRVINQVDKTPPTEKTPNAMPDERLIATSEGTFANTLNNKDLQSNECLMMPITPDGYSNVSNFGSSTSVDKNNSSTLKVDSICDPSGIIRHSGIEPGQNQIDKPLEKPALGYPYFPELTPKGDGVPRIDGPISLSPLWDEL